MTQRGKIDTKALGLDLLSGLAGFVTGREDLHYGYWHDGVEVCAGNLGHAQTAYSEKVKKFLPSAPQKILDIGGGCGEFAKDLMRDGHDVEIVVPSPTLAERCRLNCDGKVAVHVTKFEDFETKASFDLCLFVESMQYIPLKIAFARAVGCLHEGGTIVISDCFRAQEFYDDVDELGLVGGGHSLAAFHQEIETGGFEIIQAEDITEAVAPSIDLEQRLYHLLGSSLMRIDQDLTIAYPLRRKFVKFILTQVIEGRRQKRLKRRLFDHSRTSEAFCRYNRYMIYHVQRQLT